MASVECNYWHNEIDIFDEFNIDAREAVVLPVSNHSQAQKVQECLEVNPDEEKRFFSEMLADIDDPTLIFGLCNIRGNETEFSEAHLKLSQALTDQLRTQAKRFQIRLTSLCHLGWAQVLARTNGREEVVFGTVLFDRLQHDDRNESAIRPLTNILPICINMNDISVKDAARHIHARLRELFAHKFASLAMAQHCSRLPADIPLFSTLLNYRHIQQTGHIDEALRGISNINNIDDRTKYPLTLTIDDYNDNDGLRITANVVSPISAKRICAYMEQALKSLADALQHTPQQPVRTLTVLPPEERHLLLHTFNQTATTYPTDRCLHQLFEEQVTNNGNKIAVRCEGETLTYVELNAKANRLAHYLIQLGVKPDSRVGLCMSRNTMLVVGILGILKSGGAYVPLDPVYPKQRLVNILQDADPICILTDSAGENALGTHPVQMVNMEQALPTTFSDDNPGITRLGLSPNHLAYVIYTSGSTGRPKGVMVEHRNVTNFIYWTKDVFDTKDLEHTLFSTSVCFDISVLDYFAPLAVGKTIYIVPDAISLAGIPSTISMINTVPSAMTALLNVNNLPSSLHAVCLGGEPLSRRLIENNFAQSQISKLYNFYGPTETTIYSTWHKYVPDDVIVETIGKPVANTQIYLLDSQGEPVPLGAEGELYIGGAGVARGYLNRPDLTAERFLPDPFCDTSGARMYRTGDRARYLSDGNLIYLGRTDQQVKVRGYRIELGEIESCLVKHPRVREAVVQPKSDGSDTRLIAYVVADPDALLARDLRTYLSSSLPSFMVPAAYVCLSALPLTPNGKLDRLALTVPDDTAFASQSYEAPQGEFEEKMAAIWRKLLGIERISRHDNFFELGGHSLLIVNLLAQLRKDGLDTSVRAIFDSSSLATLAANIFSHQSITPPNLITAESTKITPEMLPLIKLSQAEIDIIIAQVPGGIANIQDIYGLAPLQHGILYHYMTAESGDPYLTTRRMHFIDRTAFELYANALQLVVERHDILRTSFIWEGLNEPAQVVWRNATTILSETTFDPSDGKVLEQLSRRFNTDHYKLDLSQAPLLRLIAAPTTDGGWVAIQLMHHIIGDNFTGEKIDSEVRVIVDECCKHLETPTPYRHVVAQTRLGVNPDEDKRFFSEMLTDVDDPTLPFGLCDIRGNKTDFNTADLQLPQLLNDQLRAHARRLRISLASLCHLSWAQVLAHSSGRESVVFGTVLFGRFQAAEGNDSAVGLLINTLPLRLNIDDTTVETAVRQTHGRLSELLSHEHASLALAQRCSSVPANMPLFSALFNYRHNQQSGQFTIPGMTILSCKDRTNYPLILSIDDDNDTLRLIVDVASSVSAKRICAYMEQALKSLVDALQHTPQQPVRTLTVLPPEERHLLLHTFNQTATTYPTDRCLHQLFEEQVKYHANAIAVQYEGETLTYAELNAQANRLAHHLIQLGVKPDSRVGLCMTRNTALVVGMLGILKSGGAYVPLDPVYPKQRLINILQDADPICILTDSVGQNALGTHHVKMIGIKQVLHTNLCDDNPDIASLGLKPDHLAYVLYTSGSTGRPKGVMLEHRNVTNFIYWTKDAYDTKDLEHTLFSTSVCFDISIVECFAPLAVGKAIYIVPDAISLAGIPSTISMINTVPSAMTALLNVNNLPSSMRAVHLAGEPLNKRLIEKIFTQSQISKLYNLYGPTETTIDSTCHKYVPDDVIVETIGKPVANTQIYLLDSQGEPVPLGAEGELYIGGAGVARGYLNRPDLTAERFLPDPFCNTSGARMYRTGDRARYLSDGNLIYLGRTDQQVKVRGYRIELGEIESCLVNHPRVREAVVQPKSDGSDTRLIAYVVADPDAQLARDLRTYLSSSLPSFMVPAAYVCLSALPLMPSGKLDRLALPVPDDTAFASQSYEAPQGQMEEKLAAIWRKLLGIERISRHDNFFELGGHSLLVLNLLAQLRKDGLDTSVRAIFDSSSLATLAANIFSHQSITPPNLITADSTKITPEMLPLIKLSQAEIDIIIAQVPGGIANIQDIYGLAPLQHGILYHYMTAESGDPYLTTRRMHFIDRTAFELYANALQLVVERHDILRTSFIWEGLNEPAQVVWRNATTILSETTFDPSDGKVLEQLSRRFNTDHYKLDLSQAPLLRLIAAPTTDGGWVAIQLMHHIIGDNFTGEKIDSEVRVIVDECCKHLETPTPYRHVVAQTRLGVNPDEDKRFFSEMLTDVDDPTLPFGLCDIRGNKTDFNTADLQLPQLLNDQLRAHARRLRISLASLCHLSWAQVLAHSSGRESVVFGTVLFGRFQAAEGNDSAVGLLINTLPLRLNIDDTTVETAVRQTHGRLSELLSHEHASLALAQRCSSVPANMPLFSALFNYRHNQQSGQITIPGMTILSCKDRTNYPLILSIDDDNDTLRLIVDVASSVSAKRICAYMEQALKSLVDALQHTPQQPVRTLTVLPPEERHLLLHTFNQTGVTYPTDRCLHQLFEEQVKYHANAIAVQYEGETLTYAELNAQANRLAHHLIQLGVKPDSRVAVCVARGTALVVGVLGILKSGGTYVPLDLAYKSQRLINILQDSDPLCVLADSTGRKGLGSHKVPVIDIVQPLLNKLSSENPDSVKLGLTPNHLAYIIYTSGSTGRPKGVMIEHKAIVNYTHALPAIFEVNSNSRILQYSSCSFDVSLKEIVMSLTAGAQLYIPNEDVRTNDIALLDYISSNKITHASLTPALFRCTKDLSKLKNMQALVFCGEAPTLSLFQNAAQHTVVFNGYGPTEITVAATYWLYPKDFDGLSIPIGRPISNFRTYILNSHAEPVPLGAEGELYIGGAGVARGYLNRPDLTAERFLPDPFCDTPGARMYRTGDRVRYISDKNIVFLGRIDEQVKIRGYRIEPGEIEARLMEHHKVQEAVVLPTRDGADTRLVAYIVADRETFLARDLRDYLSSLLPSYMVPAAYVCLSALPLTPSGKLDRRALPDPDDTAFASQSYETPQGQMEEKLAAIWRKLLGIERISRHDNFFELGGHSLLVVNLLAQLRQDGLDTSVRAIFDSSSLATLATNVFRHQCIITPTNLITSESTTITSEMLPLIKLSQAEIDIIIAQVPGGIANIQDIYGLAPLQHGILYHYMMAEKGDPYLIVTRLRFKDRATLELYANALQHVVERHDILRTAFIWKGLNEPAQVVWRRVPSILNEIILEEEGRPALEQLSCRFNSHNYRFDLTQAPLLRLLTAPTTDGGWVALQLFHHIICDHFTIERLNTEVHAIIDGRSNHLLTPTPFRQFVTRTRLEANPDEDKRYFSEILADIDAPTLPFGLNDVSGADTVFNEAHLRLPQVITDQLRAQTKRLQISLASLCHLAWGQVLAHSSGRESIVFGTVLLGRFQSSDGNDSVMGLLMNTLPLRLNIDDSTVEAAVRYVHAQLIELLSHEYASLAMAQRCSRLPANIPLFSALLNYRRSQHDDEIATPTPGISILNFEERTNYPLTLSIDDYNDSNALQLTAIVDSQISAKRICAYMEQALKSLADALQHTPQQPVRTLTVLPPEERHLLLHTFNQTATTYPTDRCLHQLFEEQVTNNGNKIAVRCEGETLTYVELNAKANRLAHYLIQLGVKPDSRVGLCMSRNTMLVVGILGILKSGGAYVPLDPVYPKQRLVNILQDADPICILTDSAGENALGTHQVQMVNMEQALPTTFSDDNPGITRLGLSPNHLAYVIYTSGSTGRPKGVMVEHRNVTNFIYWTKDVFDTKDLEHTLFSTSVCFDISVLDYFAPLAVGKAIYIVPDAISLAGIPSTISMINTVPSAMTALLNVNNVPSSLHAVCLGGEPLSRRLIENNFAQSQISKLYNFYGPTETTIYSTWHKYVPDDVLVETIGKPVANTQIYLLDAQGEPVPLGAEGELYIGGAGVARGYLNRPDLTAERFLPDPFCNTSGARMYRTGDRARYLYDGNLIYLGRTDQQVKVRGYRIEPGEIESCLVNHPRVREAVVQPKSDGSDTRLIAYVVADPDALLARDLRTYLSSSLPSFMVPAAFVTLSVLPQTPNGKLDRQALPVPDDAAFASQSYEAPEGELEEKLATIWRELLGIERVSRHDNFFELGGHSLLVMQLINHKSLHNEHIDPRCVFSLPILMDFAREMAHNFIKSNCYAAIPVRRTGDRMPIFALPEGHGGYSYSFELSHEIDNRYPIYALPWPSLEHEQQSSMEKLANTMITLIKKIHPNGPCALIGWSAGGLLAYEIVKQLLERNYPVAFLGLLDSYLPREERKRTKTDILLWSLAYKYPIFKTLNTSWWERARKLSLDEAVEAIKNMNTDIKNIDLERQVKLTIGEYHYQNICAAYKIQPIPFKIHLFKADTWNVPYTGSEYLDKRVKSFWESNGKYFFDHPSMGWEEFVHAKDLQVIVTKGDHYSIIKDPKHRTLLAKKIDKSLNSF